MDQLASAVLNHLLALLPNPSINAYMNMIMDLISRSIINSLSIVKMLTTRFILYRFH